MIEVRNICRTWGAFRLQGVSLTVSAGEYLVILGPCGSGKTLLLETIAGLHEPESGTILIEGKDVTRLPPERRRVGLVYQQYALFPHLSVRSNIAYGLRYRGLSRAERRRRTDEMIDLFEIPYLANRRTPRGLSGGEAQKIALARALAVDPAVLLLDEPFSSLDQQVRRRLMATLPDIIRSRNVPVIHVTHDYTEAAALADRIAVMHRGRLIQTGPARTVFRRPKNRFVADFLGVENIVPVNDVHPAEGGVRVRCGELELLAYAENVPSGPVCLTVRAEDIRLMRDDSAPDSTPAGAAANTVVAQVISLRMNGSIAEAELTAGGVLWRVRAPAADPALAEARIGGDLRLHFPPEALNLAADAPAAARGQEEPGHAG